MTKSPTVNRSKFTEEDGNSRRHEELKPYKVGLQVFKIPRYAEGMPGDIRTSFSRSYKARGGDGLIAGDDSPEFEGRRDVFPLCKGGQEYFDRLSSGLE